MARRVNLSLRNFYIFNSNLSDKEGEEEKKILFYYPNDIDIDTKIKDVGLSEAIIKFTGTFTINDKTNTDGCHALRTQKTLQVFFESEKDFWMIMTLNVPSDIISAAAGTHNDDNTEIEYKGNEVHEKIYRQVLKNSYKMFRLFAGTFRMNFLGKGIEERRQMLANKLEAFFSKFLLTLKLQTCDILDVIGSIHYLPLPKEHFLRIHNFLSMIEATFPAIKNCIFLYNEQLVWSEINATDLYSIYEYLCGTIFPKTLQNDLQGGSIRRTSYSNDSSQYGNFLIGPETDSSKVPKVYIFDDEKSDKFQSYFLIAYKSLSATICLFLDDTNPITDDFYQEIHSFMGPQLSKIASEICESFTKVSPNSGANPKVGQNTELESVLTTTKYLFLNELSLRHSGTLHLDHRRPKSSLIPQKVMNTLADIYEDRSYGISEETILKAFNDYWIVKRTSNYRQIYVVIHNNKATLLDITNEANKIIEQQTGNVFF